MKNQQQFNRRAFIASTASASFAFALNAATPQAATRKFKLKAAQARAIALTDDDLAVIAADRSLLVHRLTGELVREIKTEKPVRAICAGVNGSLFITFSNQVALVNANDEIRNIGDRFDAGSALTGIAVADDGRIFAADSALRVIWRLDAAGKMLGQIRAHEKGFAVPRAFFPISWQNGQLVVAEPGRHQIQRYSAEGRLLGAWGERSREAGGFAGCCNPVAITTLADGSVVTAERGQVRVKSFDVAGGLVRQVAGPDAFAVHEADDEAPDLFGCDGGLIDVASSAGGRLVVLDRTSREVLVFA